MTQNNWNFLLSNALPMLQLYAQHYTHTREDAEDLLQDTLLHIMERQQFYYDSNFDGWAYKTLIHLCLNHSRKRRNISIHDVSVDLTDDLIYCETTIDLGELQQPFRETMELLVAGYGYDEIARIQHISMGTVKSRIHRARKKLECLWK